MNRTLPERMINDAKRFGIGLVFWRMVKKFTRGSVSDYAYTRIEALHRKHVDYLRSLSHEELSRYIEALYHFKTGRKLDIKHPESYNEKLQWLKLHDDTEIKSTLSDKYAVREWIRENIGSDYLVPLLGVWDNPESIDFDALPQRFFLKATHDSGMNIAVRDKSTLSIHEVRRVMRKWLARTYGIEGYEPQYFDIPHRIAAEEYISQEDGNLVDYKIHCFDGVPKIIQIIGDRDLKLHTAREAFFSPEWERNDLMYHTYEQYSDTPSRPEFLDDMLKVATKLSAGFKYVRIDLYHVKDRIKFGEMTFTPACGFGKWSSEENNIAVGRMIRL